MTNDDVVPPGRREDDVVYFIASHREPQQIVRLVKRIRAERPNSLILIHHDYSKCDLSPWLFGDDPKVEFVERWVAGEWGGFSLVQLALNGIEQLFQRGHAFEWVVFISGQDYPARPLAEFEHSLCRVGDGAIDASDNTPLNLDRYRFGYFRLPRTLENRFAHRVFFVLHLATRFQPFIRFTTGRIGCRLGIRMRGPLAARGLTILKGYQWWTLSKKSLQYVRDFIREAPEVVNWFRDRVLVPDEAFFQTILSGSTFNFAADDGRYAKWSHERAQSPEVLRVSDLPEIVASEKYFARKFDIATDAKVLDLIDERSLGQKLHK